MEAGKVLRSFGKFYFEGCGSAAQEIHEAADLEYEGKEEKNWRRHDQCFRFEFLFSRDQFFVSVVFKREGIFRQLHFLEANR